jgi:hypothetical protein
MRAFDESEERVLRYLEQRYVNGRAAYEYAELKNDLGLTDQECERMYALFTTLGVITRCPTRATFHMIEPIVCNLVRELDVPKNRPIGFAQGGE